MFSVVLELSTSLSINVIRFQSYTNTDTFVAIFYIYTPSLDVRLSPSDREILISLRLFVSWHSLSGGMVTNIDQNKQTNNM